MKNLVLDIKNLTPEDQKLIEKYPLNFIECDQSEIDQQIEQNTETKFIQPSPILTIFGGRFTQVNKKSWFYAKRNKLTKPIPEIIVNDWGKDISDYGYEIDETKKLNPLDNCVLQLHHSVNKKNCLKFGFNVKYDTYILEESFGIEGKRRMKNEYPLYQIYSSHDQPKEIKSTDWEKIGHWIYEQINISPNKATITHIRELINEHDKNNIPYEFMTIIDNPNKTLDDIDKIENELIKELNEEKKEDIQRSQEMQERKSELQKDNTIEHSEVYFDSPFEIEKLNQNKIKIIKEITLDIRNVLDNNVKYNKKYVDIIYDHCKKHQKDKNL
jgi:hypothetical protein